MELLTKILNYQNLIQEQTNELPEYYVIDNRHDLRELRKFVSKTCDPDLYISYLSTLNGLDSESTFFVLGSRIIIDIIKEK